MLDCRCTNQDGKEVISGTADVIAPRREDPPRPHAVA